MLNTDNKGNSKRWLGALFPGLLALLSLNIVSSLHEAIAAGQLMVSPTRVVFEGHERSAQVNLINSGTETTVYRIGFVRKQMRDDGSFENLAVDDSAGMYSDPMVRFSPRQVTLPPGKSQLVRLMLRKPAGLAAGEYRSHLQFTAIPSTSAAELSQAVQADKEGITVELTPLVGISIPVIVRQGETSAQLTLSEPTYHPAMQGQPPRLDLVMHRSGNRSVYGNLTVTYIADSGESWIVARNNGVSVYTPNLLRTYGIILLPPQGVTIDRGRLEVRFTEPEELGGGLLASTSLALSRAD